MIEIVRGVIIGGINSERPYAFFTLTGERITRTEWFESDAAAVAWFERYPEAFAMGAEMRQFTGF